MLFPVSELGGSTKHHEPSCLGDYIFQVCTLHPCPRRSLQQQCHPGTNCLQAVRFILPKDMAMKLLVKWYNIYNDAGGPQRSPGV